MTHDISFWATEGWPLRGDTKTELQEEAVRSLLTNNTLIVGQSRSGKTSAARRLVEEVLAWTDARVVILDPNADFRYLRQFAPTRPRDQRRLAPDDAEKRFRKRWRQIKREISVAAPEGKAAWSILWGNLELEKSRAIVVDLSMDDEEVRSMLASRVLSALWKEGEARRGRFLSAGNSVSWSGTIVLVDEAHVFAPAETSDPQKRLVSERIERFADQGKKLNLHLMLVTQQPEKLNGRVLAECNNRVILRMNEVNSLRVLEKTYGGLEGRYDGALTFNFGEALLEGTMLSDEIPPSPMPRGIRFLDARTREGGGTPDKEWARPRER